MFSINFIIFFYNNLLSFKSIYTMLLYLDRKSTRLNSSHANISYAVFCLKKKDGNLAAHLEDRRRPLGESHAPGEGEAQGGLCLVHVEVAVLRGATRGEFSRHRPSD